jgi:putative ABC transport system permease protein
MLRRLIARLRAWRREEDLFRDLAEEREFHIAARAAELARRGMNAADAQAAARRRFGPALRQQELGYEARGGGPLADITADVRLAVRILCKTPARTAALVATAALGIGINTAGFSIVARALHPLPYAQASELVAIHQVSKGAEEGVSYPNFEDWRAAGRSFQQMAIYAPDTAMLTAGGEARRITGAVVSANLFHLLGVTALRGRLFADAEDAPGSPRVAIVSDRLWRSALGGREDVAGSSLTLDGERYRIVGVIPAALAFPVAEGPVDYWTTVAVDATAGPWGSIRKSRGYPRYAAAIARLRPGVTPARAQAEMGAIATAVALANPGLDLKEGVRVAALSDAVTGSVRYLYRTLYAAVFCVFAVACANAATLLLLGSLARGREFALRAAFGARPLRLVRQSLVESLVAALAAGAVAIAVAGALLSLLPRVAPPELARFGAAHMDGLTLVYACGLTILAGLLLGALPAAAARRQDLTSVLKEGGRAGARSLGRGVRPGALLIAAQIAVSMVLSCAAATLTGSFWHILHRPRGFDPHGVLTATLSLPTVSYPPGSQKTAQFYTRVVQELGRSPEVIAASAAQSLPLSGQNNSTRVDVVGDAGRGKPTAGLRFVAPAYFETLRIPLVAGEYPDARGRRGDPPVAVVNQAFVRRFLPGRNPLGVRLALGWGGDAPKTVVGVVGDIYHDALSSQPAPEVYVPLAQFPLNDMALLVRQRGLAGSVAGELRAAVRRLDPSVQLENVRTLDDYLLLSAGPQRFLMWMLAVFAAATLFLAAIGLYGALSYAAAARRHEFGVRVALGSNGWGIARTVLREGLGLALPGLVAGLLLFAAGGRLLGQWLYETRPLDLASLAAAAALMLVTAIAACLLPARRAARISPVVSLRAQ